MHYLDTMGGRISAAREAAELTVAQAARRLGVKTATLSNWENDRSEPRANRLTMLAGLLNVSPMWLITGRGEGVSEPDQPLEVAQVKTALEQVVAQQALLAEAVERLKTAVSRMDGSADFEAKIEEAVEAAERGGISEAA